MSAPDSLVSRNAVLYSLASLPLRKGNLTAIWNDAISRSGIVAAAPDSDVSDSVAIAENRSKSGMAVTTLVVGNDNGGKSQSLHIIWNTAQDRMMIVGEGKLPARIKASFANTKVQYVDRNEDNAGRKAEAALYAVVGNNDTKLGDKLKTAFLMRNMLDSLPEQETATLSDLLVRRDVKCFLPAYAVKPA